ncbi:MAG: hypothetical protein AAFQ10_03275 [Pseudomonadota bacterium]
MELVKKLWRSWHWNSAFVAYAVMVVVLELSVLVAVVALAAWWLS